MINEEVECACGCGNKLWKYDKYGRKRKFISGHNSKTPEARLAISKRNRGRKIHSEEYKKELSEKMKYDKNPSWKGGRVIDKNTGYIKIKVRSHSNSKDNYVSEHRLVMEKHLGRELEPNEIVHHINGDRSDNRIENLELTSNAKHGKIHWKRENIVNGIKALNEYAQKIKLPRIEIFCACGCGRKLINRDSKARLRRYINGHNQRGKHWGVEKITSKIGWCSATFNPVVGCKNNCIYCYARRINQRFKFIKNWNIPEWREKSFNRKFPKKPQKIFIGSMSEIAFWEREWVEKVIEKVKRYPQHIFQFLTKFPAVYGNYKFPKNCWLGVTLTSEMTKEDCWSIAEFESHNKENLKFISLEPLMEKIDLKNCVYSIKNINWVIIGAETGNRKGKIIPEKEWVLDIIKYCDLKNIPIYIKDNLDKYYPDLKDRKQFPFDIT